MIEAIQKLRKNGYVIEFYWVLVYINIAHNKLADKMTKKVIR